MDMSSISLLAWKRGSLRRSSANMQPTDHMSTAVEYVLAPRRISGALCTNQDSKVTVWAAMALTGTRA